MTIWTIAGGQRVQVETFFPSTFGRHLAASVNVISSSSGPITALVESVVFGASIMQPN
jgi:hypothetical protein